MADKKKDITTEELPEPISDQDMLLHNIIDGTPDISDLEPNSRQEVYLKYIALNGGGGCGGGSSVTVVQTTGQSTTDVMSQKAVTDEIDKLGTSAYCDTGTSDGNVPILDSNGKLPNSVIPSLAITDTFVAANEEEMLNIEGAEKGDICVRTDENKTYILDETPARYSRYASRTSLSDWIELQTPTDEVSSVNGHKGEVVLTAGDVDAYTKSEVDGKVPTIVQSKGTSTTSVMSQKAVSNNTCFGENAQIAENSGGYAFGNYANAGDIYAMAFGFNAKATGYGSIAFGESSRSSGYGSSAFGKDSKATASNSVALGDNSIASENSVVSVGNPNLALNPTRRIVNVTDPVNDQDAATKKYVDDKVAESGGESSVTVVQTTGTSTTDVMSQKAVSENTCFGYDSEIKSNYCSAFGTGSKATGSYCSSFGDGAQATGTSCSSFGDRSQATGDYSAAFGYKANATGDHSAAFGINASSISQASISFGDNSQATSDYSAALGNNSLVDVNSYYSVALGSYSKATEPSVVSVGYGNTNAYYGTRRIVNVGDPVNAQDAVTKNYLDSRRVVLYSNDAGTSDTITLSESDVNFERVGVYYFSNNRDNQNYTEYYPNSGANNGVVLQIMTSSDNLEIMYFKSAILHIEDTTVTFIRNGGIDIGISYTGVNNDVISVYKIVGINKII